MPYSVCVATAVTSARYRQVSSGQGATTCAFIAPDNRSIIYASNRLGKVRGETNVFIADFMRH